MLHLPATTHSRFRHQSFPLLVSRSLVKFDVQLECIGLTHALKPTFSSSYQAAYANWQNSGSVSFRKGYNLIGPVNDCTTTSSYSEVKINLNSTCTTNTTTSFRGSIQAQDSSLVHKAIRVCHCISDPLLYDHSFRGSRYALGIRIMC